jgi:hypothetical protein
MSPFAPARHPVDVSVPDCVCWFCGATIPSWWPDETPRPLYDVASDDEAYERWRHTACPKCGKTPAEGEPPSTSPR